MMSFNSACKTIVQKLIKKGTCHDEMKTDFEDEYGQDVAEIRVHWGADIEKSWQATAYYDEDSGEIVDIYIRRQQFDRRHKGNK